MQQHTTYAKVAISVTATTCGHKSRSANTIPGFIAFALASFLALSLLSPQLYAETTPKTVITFLGDSLTAGYGLEKNQAYPALLSDALKTRGIPNTCINAGVSGNTTAGGQRRLAWLLKGKPDILVIALGGNDGLRGIDPKASKKNLEAIIQTIRKKAPKVKILLAGMKAPPNMGESYTQAFESIFAELAKQYNVPFVPFLLEGVAGEEDANQADGIHPNVIGQKRICQHLLPSLVRLAENKTQ